MTTRRPIRLALCLSLLAMPALAADDDDSPFCASVSGKVAIHRGTGLAWQREAQVLGWKEALGYCTALKLGPFDSGWRLPTAKEISTIFDGRGFQGLFSERVSLDPAVFPPPASPPAPALMWTGTPSQQAANEVFAALYDVPGNTGSLGQYGWLSAGGVATVSVLLDDGLTVRKGVVRCVH